MKSYLDAIEIHGREIEKITKIIDKAKPNEVVAIINSIISTHKWNSTEFHPDAIRNLENILNYR